MFARLKGLFSNDIGIDLGTANSLVYVKDRGIVLREKGRERLLVELTLLRKAVAVEFARDALRRSR